MNKLALGTLALMLVSTACSGEKCPGFVCSNCDPGGDCVIQCTAGEERHCGNFGYLDDPASRCVYCAPP